MIHHPVLVVTELVYAVILVSVFHVKNIAVFSDNSISVVSLIKEDFEWSIRVSRKLWLCSAPC